MKFTHLAFLVSDYDKSISFYTEICELSVVKDRREETSKSVWLGPQVEPGKYPPYVFVIIEGEVEFKIDHLSFQVDDLKDLERLAGLGKERGFLEVDLTYLGGSLGYVMKLRDPDGHLVEFTYGQPILGVS